MILRKKRTSFETPMEGTDDFGTDRLCYETEDRAPNPERRYAQRERGRILKKAVQSLRPALRQVVEIQQLQERPMRETAEAMRVSVAAADGRQHRRPNYTSLVTEFLTPSGGVQHEFDA
jgi:DNA-directed RNA polymerase specialized sigma24 family protein